MSGVGFKQIAIEMNILVFYDVLNSYFSDKNYNGCFLEEAYGRIKCA